MGSVFFLHSLLLLARQVFVLFLPGTVLLVLAFLVVAVVYAGLGMCAFLGFVLHLRSYLVVGAVMSGVLELLVRVLSAFWMGALA
jgi:hypothetical protein